MDNNFYSPIKFRIGHGIYKFQKVCLARLNSMTPLKNKPKLDHVTKTYIYIIHPYNLYIIYCSIYHLASASLSL